MAYVFHVGDTRCYLWRDGRLHQVTTDHTISSLLSRNETREVESSGFRHVLYNAVGGNTSDLEVEVHEMELQIADTLLLSSDGLHCVVPHEELVKPIRENRPQQSAEVACRYLIDTANALGGPDNITAVVARFGAHETDEFAEAEEDTEIAESVREEASSMACFESSPSL
jgi:protein phosphatase